MLYRAGAVNVLYGTITGLTGSSSQYFTQVSPGVLSNAEPNDEFAASSGVPVRQLVPGCLTPKATAGYPPGTNRMAERSESSSSPPPTKATPLAGTTHLLIPPGECTLT